MRLVDSSNSLGYEFSALCISSGCACSASTYRVFYALCPLDHAEVMHWPGILCTVPASSCTSDALLGILLVCRAVCVASHAQLLHDPMLQELLLYIMLSRLCTSR